MLIDGAFSVSLIFNIVAIFIILGMFMMPRNAVEKNDTGTKLLKGMFICVIIGAVFDSISRSPLITGLIYVDRAIPVITEISGVGFMFLLLLYTDYAFYGSRDHLRRHIVAYAAPFAFIAVVAVINMFVGVLYTIGGAQVITIHGLYFFFQILEIFYLFIPAIYLLICSIKSGRKKFFHPLSICIPILCGVILTGITSFSLLFLGFATGLAFLTLSKVDSRRFVDAGTGFYNRAYLDYILKMIADKKGSFKGMITADIDGDGKAFSEVLKEELPSAGEIVNMGKGRYVYFADTGDLTELNTAASLVNMGAEEYDEDHPDKILLRETACSCFKDDEAIQTAIKTLTQIEK